MGTAWNRYCSSSQREMILTPGELNGIYTWVDGIPLSRPKKNISRDFSDGVLAAEVVSYYCPRLVDIHNYSAANSLAQKMYNWNTLNERVFKHLNLQLTKEEISAVASAEPLMVEAFLKLLRNKLEKYTPTMRNGETAKPEGGCPFHTWKTSRRYPSEKGSTVERSSSLTSQKSHPSRDQSDSETQTLGSQENDSSNGATPSCPPNTAQVRELQETIEVLEAKVSKLEKLMKLKNEKTRRPGRQKI